MSSSKKNKKVKKSINALLMASSMAATPAVPSLFTTIQSLSSKLFSTNLFKSKSQTTPPFNVSFAHTNEPVSLSKKTPLANRRSQSVSFFGRKNVFSSNNTEHIDPRDSIINEIQQKPKQQQVTKKSPPVFLEARIPSEPISQPKRGVQFNQTSTIESSTTVAQPDTEVIVPTVTRNISPRRIASAPALDIQAKLQPATLDTLLFTSEEDDDDKFDEDIEDLKDILGLEINDEDKWFVSSVKAKVEKRKEQKLAKLHKSDQDDTSSIISDEPEKKENDIWGDDWEEDFDQDGLEELHVPTHLIERQKKVQMDSGNIRRFAWHIEDLKLLFLDARDIATSLTKDVHPRLPPLQTKYAKAIEQIEVILDLGDYHDDEEGAKDNENGEFAKGLPSERHRKILLEIIGMDTDDAGVEKELENNEKKSVELIQPAKEQEEEEEDEEDWDAEFGISNDSDSTLNTMEPSAPIAPSALKGQPNLEFSVDMMPKLIEQIGPLKSVLNNYLADLRQLVLDG